MKIKHISYAGLDSLPCGTSEEVELLTGVLLVTSCVMEEKIHPFLIHEINDRRLHFSCLCF